MKHLLMMPYDNKGNWYPDFEPEQPASSGIETIFTAITEPPAAEPVLVQNSSYIEPNPLAGDAYSQIAQNYANEPVQTFQEHLQPAPQAGPVYLTYTDKYGGYVSVQVAVQAPPAAAPAPIQSYFQQPEAAPVNLGYYDKYGNAVNVAVAPMYTNYQQAPPAQDPSFQQPQPNPGPVAFYDDVGNPVYVSEVQNAHPQAAPAQDPNSQQQQPTYQQAYVSYMDKNGNYVSVPVAVQNEVAPQPQPQPQAPQPHAPPPPQSYGPVSSSNAFEMISVQNLETFDVSEVAVLKDVHVLENHVPLSGSFNDMKNQLLNIETQVVLYNPVTHEGYYGTRAIDTGANSYAAMYAPVNSADHNALLGQLTSAPSDFPGLRDYLLLGSLVPSEGADGLTVAPPWARETPAEAAQAYANFLKDTITNPHAFFEDHLNHLAYPMGRDGNKDFSSPEAQAILQPAIKYLGAAEVERIVGDSFKQGQAYTADDSFTRDFMIIAAVVLAVTGAGAALGGAITGAAAGVEVASVGGFTITTTTINTFVGNALINTVITGDPMGAIQGAFIGGAAGVFGNFAGGAVANALVGSDLESFTSTIRTGVSAGVSGLTSAALSGGDVTSGFIRGVVSGAVSGSITGSEFATEILPDIDIAPIAPIASGVGNIAGQLATSGRLDIASTISAFAPHNSDPSAPAFGRYDEDGNRMPVTYTPPPVAEPNFENFYQAFVYENGVSTLNVNDDNANAMLPYAPPETELAVLLQSRLNDPNSTLALAVDSQTENLNAIYSVGGVTYSYQFDSNGQVISVDSTQMREPVAVADSNPLDANQPRMVTIQPVGPPIQFGEGDGRNPASENPPPMMTIQPVGPPIQWEPEVVMTQPPPADQVQAPQVATTPRTVATTPSETAPGIFDPGVQSAIQGWMDPLALPIGAAVIGSFVVGNAGTEPSSNSPMSDSSSSAPAAPIGGEINLNIPNLPRTQLPGVPTPVRNFMSETDSGREALADAQAQLQSDFARARASAYGNINSMQTQQASQTSLRGTVLTTMGSMEARLQSFLDTPETMGVSRDQVPAVTRLISEATSNAASLNEANQRLNARFGELKTLIAGASTQLEDLTTDTNRALQTWQKNIATAGLDPDVTRESHNKYLQIESDRQALTSERQKLILEHVNVAAATIVTASLDANRDGTSKVNAAYGEGSSARQSAIQSEVVRFTSNITAALANYSENVNTAVSAEYESRVQEAYRIAQEKHEQQQLQQQQQFAVASGDSVSVTGSRQVAGAVTPVVSQIGNTFADMGTALTQNINNFNERVSQVGFLEATREVAVIRAKDFVKGADQVLNVVANTATFAAATVGIGSDANYLAAQARMTKAGDAIVKAGMDTWNYIDLAQYAINIVDGNPRGTIVNPIRVAEFLLDPVMDFVRNQGETHRARIDQAREENGAVGARLEVLGIAAGIVSSLSVKPIATSLEILKQPDISMDRAFEGVRDLAFGVLGTEQLLSAGAKAFASPVRGTELAVTDAAAAAPRRPSGVIDAQGVALEGEFIRVVPEAPPAPPAPPRLAIASDVIAPEAMPRPAIGFDPVVAKPPSMALEIPSEIPRLEAPVTLAEPRMPINLAPVEAHVPAPVVEAPVAPIIDAAQAKRIENAIDEVRFGFIDEEISFQQYSERVVKIAEEAGVPPSALTAIRAMDESVLDKVMTGGASDIFRALGSPNPEVAAYAQSLMDNVSALRNEYSASVSQISRLEKLPQAAGEVTPFNHVPGGVGVIYAGEIDGVAVIYKSDRNLMLTTQTEREVLDGLAAYGGPKNYGAFRIEDPVTGVWREAVAMEKIEGTDLLAVLRQLRAGEPPAFPITDAHLKAFDDLVSKLEANGKHLNEVNLGDIMVTANPARPLVPLDMFVVDGVAADGGLVAMLGEEGGYKSIRTFISEAKELSERSAGKSAAPTPVIEAPVAARSIEPTAPAAEPKISDPATPASPLDQLRSDLNVFTQRADAIQNGPLGLAGEVATARVESLYAQKIAALDAQMMLKYPEIFANGLMDFAKFKATASIAEQENYLQITTAGLPAVEEGKVFGYLRAVQMANSEMIANTAGTQPLTEFGGSTRHLVKDTPAVVPEVVDPLKPLPEKVDHLKELNKSLLSAANPEIVQRINNSLLTLNQPAELGKIVTALDRLDASGRVVTVSQEALGSQTLAAVDNGTFQAQLSNAIVDPFSYLSIAYHEIKGHVVTNSEGLKDNARAIRIIPAEGQSLNFGDAKQGYQRGFRYDEIHAHTVQIATDINSARVLLANPETATSAGDLIASNNSLFERQRNFEALTEVSLKRAEMLLANGELPKKFESSSAPPGTQGYSLSLTRSDNSSYSMLVYVEADLSPNAALESLRDVIAAARTDLNEAIRITHAQVEYNKALSVIYTEKTGQAVLPVEAPIIPSEVSTGGNISPSSPDTAYITPSPSSVSKEFFAPTEASVTPTVIGHVSGAEFSAGKEMTQLAVARQAVENLSVASMGSVSAVASSDTARAAAVNYLQATDAFLTKAFGNGFMKAEEVMVARQAASQTVQQISEQFLSGSDETVTNLLQRFNAAPANRAVAEALAPENGRLMVDSGGYHLAENAGKASTTPSEIDAVVNRISSAATTVIPEDRILKVANYLQSQSVEDIRSQALRYAEAVTGKVESLGVRVEVGPLEGNYGEFQPLANRVLIGDYVSSYVSLAETLGHEVGHAVTAVGEGAAGNARAIHWKPVAGQEATSMQVLGDTVSDYAAGYKFDEIPRQVDSIANLFRGVKEGVATQDLQLATNALNNIDELVDRTRLFIDQQNKALLEASQFIENNSHALTLVQSNGSTWVIIPVNTYGIISELQIPLAQGILASEAPLALQAVIQAGQNDLLRMANGIAAQSTLAKEMRAALPLAMANPGM